MPKPVYLDNQATTALDPRALEAMLPYFGEQFGNAASRSHAYGWEAEKAVDRARRQVADLARVTPREVIFTSGATESNNLAIKGALEAYRAAGDHVITVATEHKAVLDPVKRLERAGIRASIVMPRTDGLLDLDGLREAIRPETVLVSVMAANNEIGVIQPVEEIAALCRERRVVFHCDAAQGFGKIPLGGADLISVSGHKIYGPKGVGALIVRKRSPRLQLAAQMDGGGHEFGLRSGTLNVPAIVGFGEACAICGEVMESEVLRVAALRDRLKSKLENGLENILVNGSLERRLPGNLNVSFLGADSDALLIALPDVAVSNGSACTSATVEPSHVLKALGFDDARARSALRFGIGRFNTEADIDYAASRVIEAVRKVRSVGFGAAKG
ncbi:MAG TPA: aminotransferase class V-fold PLP-dependent enzyme [Bryobacteraceae bacterium]|nr:aminotransferase class V-fold PLP-dependent enzyme [Bryobacteraceae bacterium]